MFMRKSLVVVRMRLYAALALVLVLVVVLVLALALALGRVIHVVFVARIRVHVGVRMGVCRVVVRVCMVFCQMQPYAQAHQGGRGAKLPRHRFCKSQYRNQCAHKRRRRKISPRA